MSQRDAGDLVVIIPGILGSTLEQDGRPTWGHRQIIMGLPSLSLPGLTSRLTEDLHLGAEAFNHPADGYSDGTKATGVLVTLGIIPGFLTIDGYDELLTHLRLQYRDDPEKIVVFPYDWRQSNEYTARRLQAWVEPLLDTRRRTHPDARLVLVAHSMGGLVARYYAHCLDEQCRTRRIVTIGTPYEGAVKALAVLANGYATLGPFRPAIGDLVRSWPSVAELLPLFPCLGPNPDDLHSLAEIASVSDLPEIALRRCLAFHNQINQAIADHPGRNPTYHPMLSYRQPTEVWAHLDTDGKVITHQSSNLDNSGDGTVPRCSATPPEWKDGANATFLAGKHAALQQLRETRVQLIGILTTPRVRAAVVDEIAVDALPFTEPRQGWTIQATSVEGSDRLVLTVDITNPETGELQAQQLLHHRGDGTYTASITLTQPGLFRWTVHSPPPAATPIDPVTDLVLCAPAQ